MDGPRSAINTFDLGARWSAAHAHLSTPFAFSTIRLIGLIGLIGCGVSDESHIFANPSFL